MVVACETHTTRIYSKCVMTVTPAARRGGRCVGASERERLGIEGGEEA